MYIEYTITNIKFLPFQHITLNMYIKDYTRQAQIDINDSCDVQSMELILVLVLRNSQTPERSDRDGYIII